MATRGFWSPRGAQRHCVARLRAALRCTTVMALALMPTTDAQSSGAHGQAPETMRILAYNTHHGEGMDGRLDLERIAALISELDPDLVALQEIDRGVERTGGIDQAAIYGELTGLDHRFGAFMPYQGGDYGMAILSRWPIVSTTNHRLPDGDEPRTALAVRVRSPRTGRELEFVGIHLYRTEDERLAQADALVRLYEDSHHPVILAGDFNSDPGSPVMTRIADGWQIVEKGADRLTFPSTGPEREIDYFALRPGGHLGVIDQRLLDEPVASDHRPLFLELAWPQADASQEHGSPEDPREPLFLRTDLPLPGAPAYNLEPLDVDGDGDLDLTVVARADDSVVVLRNDGRGRFEADPAVEGLSRPEALAAGDLDGDGDTDLLVANAGADEVVWLHNDGAGTFTEGGRMAVGASPHAVVAVDVDADGDLDWMSSDFGGASVTVAHNDGAGRFALVQRVATGAGSERPAVLDLQRDGFPDLAVPSFSAATLHVLVNDRRGRFRSHQTIEIGRRQHIPAAADLDGDGLDDVVVTSSGTGEAVVLHGDGTGLTEMERLLLPETPWAGAALDIDGDGRTDLAVADYSAGYVHLVWNREAGLEPGARLPVGRQPHQVVTGDFDGDGRPDLAIANDADGFVTVLLNRVPR